MYLLTRSSSYRNTRLVDTADSRPVTIINRMVVSLSHFIVPTDVAITRLKRKSLLVKQETQCVVLWPSSTAVVKNKCKIRGERIHPCTVKCAVPEELVVISHESDVVIEETEVCSKIHYCVCVTKLEHTSGIAVRKNISERSISTIIMM